jgi:hypothetical protein
MRVQSPGVRRPVVTQLPDRWGTGATAALLHDSCCICRIYVSQFGGACRCMYGYCRATRGMCLFGRLGFQLLFSLYPRAIQPTRAIHNSPRRESETNRASSPRFARLLTHRYASTAVSHSMLNSIEALAQHATSRAQLPRGLNGPEICWLIEVDGRHFNKRPLQAIYGQLRR